MWAAQVDMHFRVFETEKDAWEWISGAPKGMQDRARVWEL